jgi:hypothetical protein
MVDSKPKTVSKSKAVSGSKKVLVPFHAAKFDSEEVKQHPNLQETSPRSAKPKNKEYSNLFVSFAKKNPLAFFACSALVLLVVLYFLLVFLPSQYKYSFNIDGVQFVSNYYTPSEFFSGLKDANSFVVVADLVDGNNDEFVGASERVWIIGLTANLQKRNALQNSKVVQLIRYTDSQGNAYKCFTNDGNISVGRMVSLEECNSIINDPVSYRILIGVGSENKAILSENKIEVFASKRSLLYNVNFIVVQQFVPDLEEILLRAKGIIQSI